MKADEPLVYPCAHCLLASWQNNSPNPGHRFHMLYFLYPYRRRPYINILLIKREFPPTYQDLLVTLQSDSSESLSAIEELHKLD